MFAARMLPDLVSQKLDALPAQPGVYLFKDKKGAVVYVGKAKSLRARVRSYFQDAHGDDSAFIPVLQRTIGDLETIVTANEKEATILENNLIKEHRPRYNVKLRDDKDFITLRLAGAAARPKFADQAVPSSPARALAETVETAMLDTPTLELKGALETPARGDADAPDAAQWPRLEVVRRPTPDGARYFGPYHSATAARRTLHLVNKHFQLRTCSDVEFASRRRPCLQHQIKRCPAPCVLKVDRELYDEQVDAVGMFLDGRHDELSRELEGRMREAAREMRFELAAVYRDQLRAIEKVREEQRVVTIDDFDRDVLGFYREGELVEIALLYVRAGKLADVATFSIKQAEIPDEEIVAAFLAQHYGASLAKSGEDEDAPRSSSCPTRSSCRACRRGSRASPSGSPSAPGTRSRSSFRSAVTASICSRWRTTTRVTRSPRSSGAPTTSRSASRAAGAAAAAHAPAAHRVLRHLASRRRRHGRRDRRDARRRARQEALPHVQRPRGRGA